MWQNGRAVSGPQHKWEAALDCFIALALYPSVRVWLLWQMCMLMAGALVDVEVRCTDACEGRALCCLLQLLCPLARTPSVCMCVRVCGLVCSWVLTRPCKRACVRVQDRACIQTKLVLNSKLMVMSHSFQIAACHIPFHAFRRARERGRWLCQHI